MPSFTFVSTANAFVLRGARPVFVDIRPDTLNLDERLLEPLVTPRTRAIVPVHYAGVGCEMDAILAVAPRATASRWSRTTPTACSARTAGGRSAPSAAWRAQSFHETKNITCGEGGALVINDARYVERAEILREKGTNRSRCSAARWTSTRGWTSARARWSDFLAAFLYAQLESRADIQARRRRVWECYARELPGWAGALGMRLPSVPAHCEQAYHMFYLVTASLEQRTRLIAHLRQRGILAVFHYLPLHLSEMGQRLGGKPGDCPVTEDLSDRVLRLPLYNDLGEEDQAYVVDSLRAFDG